MQDQFEQTLLGDIGATNARFCLLSNGTLGPVANFEVARYPRFADVVTDFLKMHPAVYFGTTPSCPEDAITILAECEGFSTK